jgi:hypothetical protein
MKGKAGMKEEERERERELRWLQTDRTKTSRYIGKAEVLAMQLKRRLPVETAIHLN